MDFELESACWEVRRLLYHLRIGGFLDGKPPEDVARLERVLLRFVLGQRVEAKEIGKCMERERWMRKIESISLS